MTQALSIFRSDKKATSTIKAMAPACKMTGKASGLTKASRAQRNMPNKRIYLPDRYTSRSSFMYRYTASPPMISAIKTSISDLLDDLNMLLKAGFDKVNKLRTYLLFGENRKRRQRKPFRGLHLLFGSRHFEVSGGQVMAACKDPVAPVALMTGGSFECAAAGLEGSITLPSKAHRSLGTSSVFSDLDPMPLGDCEDPVFHLECVRPAGHNAQAISVTETAYQGRLTLARGCRPFLLGGQHG
jgi:hypothetical protein